MRLHYLLLVPALILFFFLNGRSPVQLKGQVLDMDGEPIPGASIIIKDSKSKTVCDSQGKFILTVISLPVVLQVSAVGYETKELNQKEAPTGELIIRLEGRRVKLEEVVVTGYSSIVKDDVAFSTPITLRGISSKVAGISASRGRKGKEPVVVMHTDKPIVTPGAKEILPHANVLTAGELSDFKKWKLWGDYSKKEFSEYGKHWNIFPRQRYCVQVQN